MVVNKTLDDVSADRAMTGNAYAVLLHMIATADSNNLFIGTLDEIAGHVQYDRKGTARAIKRLCEAGLIEKRQRAVYRVSNSLVQPMNMEARNNPDLVGAV